MNKLTNQKQFWFLLSGGKMLVFSLAWAPLSVFQDATRAVSLLYCRSPRNHPNEWIETSVFPLFHFWKQLDYQRIRSYERKGGKYFRSAIQLNFPESFVLCGLLILDYFVLYLPTLNQRFLYKKEIIRRTNQ